MAPDDGQAFARPERRGTATLIDRYQEMARLSRAMLEAAHRSDWEAVARIEALCRLQIGELKRAAIAEPLGAEEQRRRIELMREMLRDDAQIRRRAEPWLLELERLVGMPSRSEPSRSDPSD
jgi:flagellar protein FliT